MPEAARSRGPTPPPNRAESALWRGHPPTARALPPRRAECRDTRQLHDHAHWNGRRAMRGNWRGPMRRKVAVATPIASRRGRGCAAGGQLGCGAGPAVAAAQTPLPERRAMARRALRAVAVLGAGSTLQPRCVLRSGWSAARLGGSSPPRSKSWTCEPVQYLLRARQRPASEAVDDFCLRALRRELDAPLAALLDLLRRLRLPLPFTAARCRCHQLHDPLGDHIAACPR